MANVSAAGSLHSRTEAAAAASICGRCCLTESWRSCLCYCCSC